MKDLSKTFVLTVKQFENIGRKKEQKHYSWLFKKPHRDRWTLTPSIEYRPCKQEELNRIKIEKSIQIKTVGTLQD